MWVGIINEPMPHDYELASHDYELASHDSHSGRTMSGRRMRDTIAKVLVENGFTKDVIPVIAGLSNTYADYVATFEEYQVSP